MLPRHRYRLGGRRTRCFDDGQFVSGKGGRLKRGSARDFEFVGRGCFLTSVLGSIGLFRSAHAGKQVLASIGVSNFDAWTEYRELSYSRSSQPEDATASNPKEPR